MTIQHSGVLKLIMKEFFKVTDLENVFEHMEKFSRLETQEIPLVQSLGRILARDIVSDMDIPDFDRSTMDGYAVKASSSFGASESSPAYLTIKGTILMGASPNFSIGPGEAARISTGGMLPAGADAVVMVEHTDILDDTTIEIYSSVAPGQHMVTVGEDLRKKETIIHCGQIIRPAEAGLMAALGIHQISVYRKPVVAILSTGDEIVPIEAKPALGEIRDINTYTLSAQIEEAGAVPVALGISGDDFDDLFKKCSQALEQADMVIISGGSSVGTRDFTIEVLSSLDQTEILFHGISISPGKPTILANSQGKPFWGLPGHVVSAMVVFSTVVQPFIHHMGGRGIQSKKRMTATLTRNLPSAQGRVDFIRVRLWEKEERLMAEPVLGKSGLISTMVKADGLIEIGKDMEGLEKGAIVSVIPL
jgi:molybdopterin molybdotransferase